MTSTFVFEFFAWPQLDVFFYVTPLHSQTQGAWTSILLRPSIDVHAQGAFRLFKLPFQNCEFLA